MVNKLKILGVGFHKTGTTTLAKCLRLLDYDHKSYCVESFDQYIDIGKESLINTIEEYDSFDDWPWPFLYKEIHAKYPDSKFVLTLRKDEGTWYKSFRKHVERREPCEQDYKFLEYLYGCRKPEEDEQLCIERYKRHNEEMREYFADKPDCFLELCWENGDEWDKLCEFLGVPVPNVSFPHSNKNPEMMSLLERGMELLKKVLRFLRLNTLALAVIERVPIPRLKHFLYRCYKSVYKKLI